MININDKKALIISGVLFASAFAMIASTIVTLRKSRKQTEEDINSTKKAIKQLTEANSRLDLLMKYTAQAKDKDKVVEEIKRITEEALEENEVVQSDKEVSLEIKEDEDETK